MSIIDEIKAQQAARTAALENVEIAQSSNLTINPHQMNQFSGSLPIFDLDGPAGDGPVSIEKNIPSALKVDNIVLTEIHAFQQPEGGFARAEERNAAGGDWNWMTQIEGTMALPMAVLGFIEDGEFEQHPVYDDSSMTFVTSRALEVYFKSPFRVPEESVEQMRQAAIDHEFVPAELGDRVRESKRKELFHLQAKSTGSNTRDRILSRQTHGMQIESFTLTAPRDASTRPNDSSGNPVPEYEDFLRSFEENLHRVIVSLASGESVSKAGRLSTAITGVNGQYPLRATCASLSWGTPVMGGKEVTSVGFFPASTSYPEG